MTLENYSSNYPSFYATPLLVPADGTQNSSTPIIASFGFALPGGMALLQALAAAAAANVLPVMLKKPKAELVYEPSYTEPDAFGGGLISAAWAVPASNIVATMSSTYTRKVPEGSSLDMADEERDGLDHRIPSRCVDGVLSTGNHTNVTNICQTQIPTTNAENSGWYNDDECGFNSPADPSAPCGTTDPWIQLEFQTPPPYPLTKFALINRFDQPYRLNGNFSVYLSQTSLVDSWRQHPENRCYDW